MRITRIETWTRHGADVVLVVLSYPFAVVIAVLWQLTERERPWRASLHVARGLNPTTATYDLDTPTWQSSTSTGPKPPVDALLAHLAILGLPPDTTPLVTALLPPD